MSRFSIDTDKVDNVADDINSLATKSSSIKSSVSGYDTSNSDGFDFAGAKNAILNNLEGIETKIKNTAKLLNVVTETHGSLQNSVNDGGGSKTPTARSTNTTSGGGTYTYSGGGRYSGRGSTSYGGYGDSTVEESNDSIGGIEGAIATPVAIDGKIESIESSTNNILKSVLNEEQLSAVELLEQVLGTSTAATAINASSILEEKDKEALEEDKNKVLEDSITVDQIASASSNKTIIVLERRSTDIDEAYQNTLKEVASKLLIPFKILSLDGIINSLVNSTSLNIQLTDAIEENTSSKEENSTEALENNNNNNTNQEETNNKTEDQEQKEEENIPENKEEMSTSPNTPYSIEDKETYDKLMSIPTAGIAKHNIETTPVTLIIRNNVILSSINGVTTKEKLESILSELGMSNNSTSV